MEIPNGMLIPKKKIYQTKKWNGGRNVIPFPHSIPSCQVGLKLTTWYIHICWKYMEEQGKKHVVTLSSVEANL